MDTRSGTGIHRLSTFRSSVRKRLNRAPTVWPKRCSGLDVSGLVSLGRTYRHWNRYREVAGILAKHGFGDVLHALRLDHYAQAALKTLLPQSRAGRELSRPQRVRLAIEELGPTFVKAGQYLSTRPDVVEPEYLHELARLQDSVHPFPFDDARRIVEQELRRPLEKCFARFERKPLAAASIAQVHAAVLEDGRPVVVKIQRPGLRQAVRVDLEIMAHLAAVAERHGDADSLGGHKPTRLVAEIAQSLDRELDFSLEAAHLERFRRMFAGDPTVRAPKVLRELSSPLVITMERLDGIKADDLPALAKAGIDRRAVAAALARHYLSMIFVHGFFHADPHPGNLLVAPGPVIGYLDFGMTGRLERYAREALADVVLAVAERDVRRLTESLLTLADFDQPPAVRALRQDVAELMDQYAYRPISEWRLGRMLEQLLQTTGRHRVRVPASLFLLLKTLTELENLSSALDPDFDVVAAAAPFVRWTAEQRLQPRRLLEDAVGAGQEALRLLRSAPGDLREILRQARRGKLLIEFEHKGLEPALSTLDRVTNRLAFAVLLGALLIGSALLLHAGAAQWPGVSLLGLSGFVVAGLMALWLLSAILRHGRL